MTRLTKALLLVGGVLLGLSQGYADDSCGYARDGACDEPLLCATDTDGTDCAGVPAEVRAGAPTEAIEDAPLPLDESLPTQLWYPIEWAAWSHYLLPTHFGLDPETTFVWLAIGGVILALYLRRKKGPASTETIRDLVWRAMSPDVRTGDVSEIAEARRQCKHIAGALEKALGERNTKFRIYVDADAVSVPWLRVDCVIRDERGSFLTNLVMDFKPQPFGMIPVLVDFEIDQLGRRRRITSAYEFGSEQIALMAACLGGASPPFRWTGARAREMPWQLTREQQRIALFEAPLMTSARAALKMIGLFAGLALALLAFGAAPAITIQVGLGAYLAYRHFHVPPPNYRIVAACPPHPPRDLRGLDSWQTVVRDLGEQRDVVLDRFEAMLADRFSDASEPISIRRENIWYSGAEDKVERQQLALTLRRAIVFVRIDRYGRDLFVGWDAHVNLLSWKDRALQKGYQDGDGLKVELVGIETQYHQINEYDITDANFLLEATHTHLSSLVKDVLREREIDQEVDFSIVRESRQKLIEASPSAANGSRRRFFRKS